METTIVAGRVGIDVKERATKYIRAAGLTVGDVIRSVMESIARTGIVPECSLPGEMQDQRDIRLKTFADLRTNLPACPELAEMTDTEMRGVIALRLEQNS